MVEIGVHDMPAWMYHKDPAPEPSLSSSLAKMLVDRSAAHAWRMHPKLGNRMDIFTSSREMNIGSAAHSVVLEHDWDSIAFIDAADYRTKAAKEARDKASAEGKTPILEKDRVLVEGMVSAMQKTGIFKPDYLYEKTLVWRDWETGGFWGRARVDALDLFGNGTIYDLKTTGVNATPEGWGRTRIWEYAMQCGFYRRAVFSLAKFIWGENAQSITEPPRFIFVVQETDPPYSTRRFEFDHAGYQYADMLAEKAMKEWSFCMHNNQWEGYKNVINTVRTPNWIIWEMEAR